MPHEPEILPDELVRAVELLAANRSEIDFDNIRRQWAAVAKGEEPRTAWLEAAFARAVQ
jgi:hypothetical protein